MKKTKAKRKLLAKSVLIEAAKRKTLGVSINRLKLDLNINMSRTSLNGLIRMYTQLNSESVNEEQKEIIRQSLFPTWLLTGPVVQEQPDNWAYEGFFPYGRWVQ